MNTQPIWQTSFILLCLCISGCQLTGQTVAEDTVTIGVIAPLSGALAPYGIAFRNGIEMADTENIEFIYEDSMYEPATAVTAYRSLAARGVDVIFNWGNPTSTAITSHVDSTGVPLVAFSFDPSLTKDSEYTIRAWPLADAFGKKHLEHFQQNNYKRVAMVVTNIAYTNAMYDAVVEHADDVEVVLIRKYQFGDKDFRNAIIEIKEGDFDAVGVFLATGQIHQFYIQAHNLGLAAPTLGTDFFEDDNEVLLAQGHMNGAVYPNMQVSQEFRSTYDQIYGNTNQITFAGSGYDMANYMPEVDFTNKDTIMNSLQTMHGYEGVLGRYTYHVKKDDAFLAQPVLMKTVS